MVQREQEIASLALESLLVFPGRKRESECKKKFGISLKAVRDMSEGKRKKSIPHEILIKMSHETGVPIRDIVTNIEERNNLNVAKKCLSNFTKVEDFNNLFSDIKYFTLAGAAHTNFGLGEKFAKDNFGDWSYKVLMNAVEKGFLILRDGRFYGSVKILGSGEESKISEIFNAIACSRGNPNNSSIKNSIDLSLSLKGCKRLQAYLYEEWLTRRKRIIEGNQGNIPYYFVTFSSPDRSLQNHWKSPSKNIYNQIEANLLGLTSHDIKESKYWASFQSSAISKKGIEALKKERDNLIKSAKLIEKDCHGSFNVSLNILGNMFLKIIEKNIKKQ